jgi:hypothetical protein
MKAAVVDFSDKSPIYREFEEPVAGDNEILLNVTAAALSQVTRAMAEGKHYSSTTEVPIVAGIDGVGRRRGDAKRTYFFMPRAPFGSMAQHSVALKSRCVLHIQDRSPDWMGIQHEILILNAGGRLRTFHLSRFARVPTLVLMKNRAEIR